MRRVYFRTRTVHGHGEFGSFLNRQRLQLGLELAVAAHAAHLDQKYLAALEEERLEELPGKMYAHCFLRTYAEVLGLMNQLPLLEERLNTAYQRHVQTTNHLGKIYGSRPISRRGWWQRMLWTIPVGIFLVLMVGEIVSFLSPPHILITTPQRPNHPFFVTEDALLIQGESHADRLDINGVPLPQNQKEFVHTVPLFDGLNHIVISGHNKLGTKKTTNLFVYYHGKNKTAAVKNSTRGLN